MFGSTLHIMKSFSFVCVLLQGVGQTFTKRRVGAGGVTTLSAPSSVGWIVGWVLGVTTLSAAAPGAPHLDSYTCTVNTDPAPHLPSAVHTAQGYLGCPTTSQLCSVNSTLNTDPGEPHLGRHLYNIESRLHLGNQYITVQHLMF